MKQTIRTHSERVPHSLTLARQTAITLFALLLTFFAPPTTAWADNFTYIDANGTGKSHEAVPLTNSDTELTTGWYIVNEDVTIDSRITVTGDVHIILMDDKNFTASEGITVNYNATANNALTIYAQSTGMDMGSLSIESTSSYYAGIGGESGMTCGMVTINGGNITVNGGSRSAGIGGGGSDTSGDGTGGQSGTITINGGNISAKSGGDGAAAIGAAANAKAASLTDVIRLNWTNTNCHYETKDGGYSSGRLMLIKPFNIESTGNRATLNDLATTTVLVARDGETLHSVTYKIDGNVFEQYYAVESDKAENLQFYPAGKLIVWYEEDCSEPWNFELPVTKNLVLEATNIVAYTTNSNGSIADYFMQDGDNIDTNADALQDAVNKVPNNGTVVLTKDVNDFDDYTSQIEFSSDKSMILNLNGRTISGGTIQNSITLTITDNKGGGMIIANGFIYCVLNNSSGVLTIDGGEISGNNTYNISNMGTLTINGGSIVATSCGIENGEYGLLTVNGGTISAVGESQHPGTAIANYGTLTVSGGLIENSSIGIDNCSDFALTGLPTFSGNDVDISLFESYIDFTEDISSAPTTLIKLDLEDTSYSFTRGYATHCVGFPPSRMFEYVGDRDNVFMGHDSEGEGKTRDGYRLMDDSDNSSTITTWNDNYNHYVQLYGRTFYRNGDWNTLCLPFSLTETQIAHSNLEGAIIMELDAANSNLDGNGELTLTFISPTADDYGNVIKAGKPYIVRWNKNANLANIIDPIFTDVKISVTEPEAVTFNSNCQFVGQFSPFAITESNINEILMLGSGSSLGYSQNPRTLKCFRAHFVIPTSGNQARSIVMNFDDEGTGIKTTDYTDCTDEDEWYTLDGRKLSGAPTTRGIYVRSISGRSQGKNNGKKIIIK